MFQDADDELEFVDRLRNLLPGLALIDGPLWRRDKPDTKALVERDSPTLLLWDQRAFPRLPSIGRADGFLGPSTGPVIQWIRCRRNESEIVSGRLASSIDPANSAESAFTKMVWKVARACLPHKAVDKGRAGGRIVRAGRGAAEGYRRGLDLRLDATFVLFDIVE